MVEERIIELNGYISKRMEGVKFYDELTEIEKASFRIMQAEVIALKAFITGESLNELLDDCINKERYCGAEGIKRAEKWLTDRFCSEKIQHGK